MLNQETIIKHVIKSEGGERINMDEGPGHDVSKYGVTRQTLEIFRGKPTTVEDVFALTEDEAIAVYKKDFWDKMNLDLIKNNPTAQAMLMDQGLNRGAGTVCKQLALFLNERFKATLNTSSKLTPEVATFTDTISERLFAREFIMWCQLRYNDILIGSFTAYQTGRSEENFQKLERRFKWISGWTKRLRALNNFVSKDQEIADGEKLAIISKPGQT